eukprot:m.592752 g.592752  ORF g.592752 m.592752 type:complete len:301 (+) comp22391_c0_seq26:236-1138(+)
MAAPCRMCYSAQALSRMPLVRLSVDKHVKRVAQVQGRSFQALASCVDSRREVSPINHNSPTKSHKPSALAMSQRRWMAAKKGKGGGGKAKGGKANKGGAQQFGYDSKIFDSIKETVSDLNLDMDKHGKNMEATLSSLQKHLDTIRPGEVSPSQLDNISISMDGSNIPLVSVAQVAKKDGQTLLVTVFDPSITGTVEAAVRDSGLGLTPSRQGNVVKLVAPKMTQEYRQSLVKMAKEHLEKSKVRLRRVRTDCLKAVKQDADGYGKDQVKRLEKCVEAMADAGNAALTSMYEAKVGEIESI